MAKQITKQQMAVQVAKDVLAQLKAKKLIAQHRVYVKIREFKNNKKVEQIPIKNGSVKLQEVFKQIKTCNVCAQGAMFVAAVDRYNRETASIEDYRSGINDASVYIDLVDDYTCDVDLGDRDVVNKFFTKEEFDLIEMYFEGRSYSTIPYARVHDLRANAFYNSYDTAEQRMIAIMQNIIENKGVFNPINLKFDQELYIAKLEHLLELDKK